MGGEAGGKPYSFFQFFQLSDLPHSRQNVFDRNTVEVVHLQRLGVCQNSFQFAELFDDADPSGVDAFQEVGVALNRLDHITDANVRWFLFDFDAPTNSTNAAEKSAPRQLVDDFGYMRVRDSIEVRNLGNGDSL